MNEIDVYMPRVIKADYISDYVINIEFSNGVNKNVDCRQFLDGGIFEELKDLNYFKKFFVDGWTISWQNGADIAPETIYDL